ncbi:MAG: prepilin-type N-terminal cleavage/methylation domain-containing protein [Candidatus Omnitrophica bacterium]|nr:prepilin-type N-terminal cleavage/methylation domain-containing protein [Candidatus Omnitrophota bacterium]
MVIRKRGSLAGFTLIELIIAVFIAVIMITAVYASFKAGLDGWRKAKAVSDFSQNVRIALSQMSRELRGAIISRETPCYNFIGRDGSFKGESADTLTFTTTSSGQRGLSEITYFINSSSDASFSELKRRYNAVLGSDVSAGEEAEVLAMFITGLDIKYYSGERWEESWAAFDSKDSDLERRARAKGLPRAVKVTLFAQNPLSRKGPLVFSTVISIPVEIISAGERGVREKR